MKNQDRKIISNEWSELVYVSKKFNIPVSEVVRAKEQAKTNNREKIYKYLQEQQDVKSLNQGLIKDSFKDYKEEQKPESISKKGINIHNNKITPTKTLRITASYNSIFTLGPVIEESIEIMLIEGEYRSLPVKKDPKDMKIKFKIEEI